MTLLPPTIADERFKILEQLVERLQGLNHEELLKVYFPQVVDRDALFHLAQQFNVDGLRGWFLADTEQKQRDLIENAIAINRKAGTPFAILQAMESVGYPNATIEENPPLRPDGTWKCDGSEICAGKRLAGFFVDLDPTQSQVSTDRIELLLALIDEWKPARSKLLDLTIGSRSLLENPLRPDGTWKCDGTQDIDGVFNEAVV